MSHTMGDLFSVHTDTSVQEHHFYQRSLSRPYDRRKDENMYLSFFQEDLDLQKKKNNFPPPTTVFSFMRSQKENTNQKEVSEIVDRRTD